VSLFFASLLFVAQAAAPQPPAPQIAKPANASPTAPQNASAPKPIVEPTPDPASSHFLTEAGVLLVAIKPAAIADYDLVIQTLQEALAKDKDPVRLAAAKGWRVYKAEADAKGNQIYVHLLLPTVTGFDYRPSILLDELVEDLAPQLLSRYQEAFAAPPNKLSLSEFANMSVAPVSVTPPTTTPPTTTPPVTKKPPGG
jgi:hypothetical protein